MAFSVSEFTRAFKYGIAKPNRFRVFIYPNPSLATKIGIESVNSLSIACQRAELPGRSLFTTEHYMYGTKSTIPYGNSYIPITLSFLCDAILTPRKFFDDWQSFICNPRSNYMSYYDDYVSVVKICQFSDEGILTHVVQLDEAYPVFVSPMPLDANQTNQPHICEVQLQYRRWLSTSDLAEGGDSGVSNNGGFNEPLIALNTSGNGATQPNFDETNLKIPGANGDSFFPKIGGFVGRLNSTGNT